MACTPVGMTFMTLYLDFTKRVLITCSKRFLILKNRKCFGMKSEPILRYLLLTQQERVLPHSLLSFENFLVGSPNSNTFPIIARFLLF